MESQKRHEACKTDWGNTQFCAECLDTANCPADTLAHAKNRVYEDFAKKRAKIERLPDGQKKTKALILWHTLWGLCNNNP